MPIDALDGRTGRFVTRSTISQSESDISDCGDRDLERDGDLEDREADRDLDEDLDRRFFSPRLRSDSEDLFLDLFSSPESLVSTSLFRFSVMEI